MDALRDCHTLSAVGGAWVLARISTRCATPSTLCFLQRRALRFVLVKRHEICVWRVRLRYGGIGRRIRRLGKPGPSAGSLQELLKSTDVYDLDRQATVRLSEAERIKAVRGGVVPRRILSYGLMTGLARTTAENPLSYILKSDDKMARLRPEDLVDDIPGSSPPRAP